VTKVLSYWGGDSLEPQPVTALYHMMCDMKVAHICS